MGRRSGQQCPRPLAGHPALIAAVVLLLILITLAVRAASTQAQSSGRWPATFTLPYMRRNHTAIVDAAHGRLILFGGWNGRRLFNDVWVLDLSPGTESWSRLQPAGVRPRPRAWHSAIYDAAGGRMVVFGGRGYGDNLADTWALDLTPGSEEWVQLAPGGTAVSTRYGHSAVHDADTGRMVVYGGAGGGTLLGDLWVLDLTPGSESWSALSPAGGPPQARAFQSAVIDTANLQMVMFGGQSSSGNLGDVWALALTLGSEAWTQLAPAGTPPPGRRSHSSVYHAGQERMLVYGGVDSAGFLGDLWALDLAPGSESWAPITGTGGDQAQSLEGSPLPRAWQAAALDAVSDRLLVLGGFGPVEALLSRQWILHLDTETWNQLQATEPVLASIASMSLQVEDAPDGVIVNKLLGSSVDVVVRLSTTSLEASQGFTVTLTTHDSPLGMPDACFRLIDGGACQPMLYDYEPDGRFTVNGVRLYGAGGVYQGQVVFRFAVSQVPEPAVVDLTAQASFRGAGDRDATGALRVCRHADALIVTNRTRLFEEYDPDQVRLLLGRLYEIAEGEGGDHEPQGVVGYVDRFDEVVAAWDNWAVDYGSENAANVVASRVDWAVEGWAYYADDPTYLLIVGDDDIVPFYRMPSFGDEAEYPEVGNHYKPLNDVVSNDYYLTDSPYADLDDDWHRGDLEMASGRIVGASAEDMVRFLDNSRLGPAPDSGQAVVFSVRGEEPEWYTGEAVRDAILDGPDNDLVDALRDEWGLDILNDAEDPVTIETRGWVRDDLEEAMERGFLAFQSMGHADNDVLLLPDPERLTPLSLSSLEEDSGIFSTHRPFLYIHGCRAGLTLARDRDDGLVWSLAHHGASGVIASAGVAYSDWDDEVTSSGETLANQFWLEAIEGGGPSGTLGLALREAKRDFEARYDWSDREKKTVQAYTLFGLPWTSLPDLGAAGGAEQAAASPELESDWTTGPRHTDDEDAYEVSTTVDASSWVQDTLYGYDVIRVDGMRLSRHDDAPVVPARTLRLRLPRGAAVTDVEVRRSGAVDLGTLQIPTFLHRPDYAGGPPSVYTETLDAVGVYPDPAEPFKFDNSHFGFYQLARVSLTPLEYDAVSDQATLHQQVDVTVTYTSTTPVLALSLKLGKEAYLPGEPIGAQAWLANVGDSPVDITPTLSVIDPVSRTWAAGVGAPVSLPAGELTAVPMVLAPNLEEGDYRLRFAAQQGGRVLAWAVRSFHVSAGRLSGLTGPRALAPDATGDFAVSFANAGPAPVAAMVHLAVLDGSGQTVSQIQPRVILVPANTTATPLFQWGPGGVPAGAYTVVARALSGGHVHGPRTRIVRVKGRLYLPLVSRSQ